MLSIRHKLTGAFFLLSLLPIAVGTFFAIRSLIAQTETQAWETVRKDVEIANFALDQRQTAMRAIASRLAETVAARPDGQVRQTDALADYLNADTVEIIPIHGGRSGRHAASLHLPDT